MTRPLIYVTFISLHFLFNSFSLAAGHLGLLQAGEPIANLKLKQGDSGTVTITNDGDEELNNLQISIPAIWASYFTHDCTNTIAAAANCTLSYNIPTVAPSRATRPITFSADNTDNCPLNLSTRIYVVGGLKCWGLNLYGQLGAEINHGTNNPNNYPTEVTNLTAGVVAVSTGSAHSCALLATGDVQCWGLNQHGQLGTSINSGTLMENHTPMPIDALSGSVLAISNGTNHSCALLTTGNVYCWGLSQEGQIGRMFRSTLSSENSMPHSLDDIGTNASLITGGAFHSCALLNDGVVQCWGWNFFGQLGNTSTVEMDDSANYSPLTVQGLSSRAISLSGGAYHTCALLDTGDIECWGQNTFGQLGNPLNSGASNLATPSPMPVQNLGSPALSIISGAFHSCALLQNGLVKCWGDNYFGQLGNSTNSGDDQHPANDNPLTVNGLSGDVAMIAAGVYHNCALLQSGGVECWGNNLYGQLGNTTNSGESNPNITPLPVQGITNALGLANHNFGYTSCVLY